MSSLIICTPHQILFGWSNREEWDRRRMWQVWGKGEVHTGFWWGNLRERDYLEHLGAVGRTIFKCIFSILDREQGLDWSGSE